MKKNGFLFSTLSEYYINKPLDTFVILRHDVDRNEHNALHIAKLEKSLHIKASYYFRCKKGKFEESTIKEISSLGHEIGYHYETLAKANGIYHEAFTMFKAELCRLREIAQIKTICAHGSPLSKWDSRSIWSIYNFHDLGILGEPYISIDYNKVLYLTDTGRKWNGSNVSIRDKVISNLTYNYQSTFNIIQAIMSHSIPTRIMLNIHPHRWNNSHLPWMWEYVGQNFKNILKWVIIKAR